ncbi:MAG: imidazole glycerol phosphate synthase subunit HisH [Candidatus Omnitrophica bacterium]|nr:imidazole glycerol phosphate synthase subunit HisH [Candidatus Omnitrophota bacterium]
MIGIIDYGSGNLRSVYNAFRYLGENAKICTTFADLKTVSKIVLPGVGSSKDAMTGLEERGFIEVLKKEIASGKLFMGICLGLQLLFDRSEESGGCDGLGLIKGEVKLFPAGNERKIPQIGWNTVKFMEKDCPVFKGIKDETYFYFVHSYYCDCVEKEYISGMTEYGETYASGVWKDNVFAFQFHPERSQDAGLKVLKNFIEL